MGPEKAKGLVRQGRAEVGLRQGTEAPGERGGVKRHHPGQAPPPPWKSRPPAARPVSGGAGGMIPRQGKRPDPPVPWYLGAACLIVRFAEELRNAPAENTRLYCSSGGGGMNALVAQVQAGRQAWLLQA